MLLFYLIVISILIHLTELLCQLGNNSPFLLLALTKVVRALGAFLEYFLSMGPHKQNYLLPFLFGITAGLPYTNTPGPPLYLPNPPHPKYNSC